MMDNISNSNLDSVACFFLIVDKLLNRFIYYS